MKLEFDWTKTEKGNDINSEGVYSCRQSQLSALRVACLVAAEQAKARAKEDSDDKELVGIYEEQAAMYEDLYCILRHHTIKNT